MIHTSSLKLGLLRFSKPALGDTSLPPVEETIHSTARTLRSVPEPQECCCASPNYFLIHLKIVLFPDVQGEQAGFPDQLVRGAL